MTSCTANWEFGAPAGHHCCAVNCDYNPEHDDPIPACWTLLNPPDGGDPLYFCYECQKTYESRLQDRQDTFESDDDFYAGLQDEEGPEVLDAANNHGQ